MDVHDEMIPDRFYRKGWANYVPRGIQDNVSAETQEPVIIHYLAMRGVARLPSCHLAYRSPIKLFSAPLSDDTSVEEIRCTVGTLGDAYAYYVRRVVENPHRQTLLSVCHQDLKSPCFEVPCLCSRVDSVPMGAATFETPDRSLWEVGTPSWTVGALVDSMCDIGITPIITTDPSYTVRTSLLGRATDVITKVFRPPVNASIQVLGAVSGGYLDKSRGEGPTDSAYRYLEGVGTTLDGRCVAVRTAAATISVVLTPRSLYGGKNPETKEVSIVVHTVMLQESGWNPSAIVQSVR